MSMPSKAWLVVYGVLIGFVASGAVKSWPLLGWGFLCIAAGLAADQARIGLIGPEPGSQCRRNTITAIVVGATFAALLYGRHA